MSEQFHYLDILTSNQGKIMLNMVTQDFYNNSRIGIYLFQALGTEWDDMADWSQNLNLEIFPQTCTWSIYLWEFLHDIKPDDSLSLEFRRLQLMQKVLYQAPISPQNLRALVLLCSGADDVLVEDFTAPYTFSVTVISTEEITNMIEIWELIYRVKPSHLRFNLFFRREIYIDHQLHTGLHLGYHRQMTELPEEEWTKTEEESTQPDGGLIAPPQTFFSLTQTAEETQETPAYSRKAMRTLLNKKDRTRTARRTRTETIEITQDDVLKAKQEENQS